MMELVDIPGRSSLVSVSKLGTCHLKRVGGVFRDPCRASKIGMLKILFDDVCLYERLPLQGKR